MVDLVVTVTLMHCFTLGCALSVGLVVEVPRSVARVFLSHGLIQSGGFTERIVKQNIHILITADYSESRPFSSHPRV